MFAVTIGFIIGFFISITLVTLMCHCIRDYIYSQPPGSLPLFITISKEVNFFAQIQGTFQCFIAICACFDFVVDFTRSSNYVTLAICVSYEIAATCTCANLSIFCLVRVMGVLNSTVLEENVSEKLLLYLVFVLDSASSLAVIGSIFVAGEFPSGSIYSLATRQVVSGGRPFLL